MRFGKIWKKIEVDQDMHIGVMSRGLNQLCREWLKDGGTTAGDIDQPLGITHEQLELWPSALQQFITDIRRTRVYVPSRGEHVLVTPTELSRAEAYEAGVYLKRVAAETDREGELLIALSSAPAPGWR